MTSQTAFSQLQSFLKDMFQFDDHDLDFGIYRIIRLKRITNKELMFNWNLAGSGRKGHYYLKSQLNKSE